VFAHKKPATQLTFFGLKLDWSDELNIVGVTFNVADMLNGMPKLKPPAKARKALARIKAALRGLHPHLARLIYLAFVRSTMLYGCEALEPHPQSATRPERGAHIAAPTFRCTRLARVTSRSVCLTLLYKQLVFALPQRCASGRLG
jgi:hypothetical protein